MKTERATGATVRLAAAALAVLLAAAPSAGCAAQAPAAGGSASPGGAGPADADGTREGGRLYVPNQADATVSIVDLASREVVETVDLRALGYPPDAKPHDVVAADDGSAWYVSLIGANTVVKLDADNEVVAEASLEVPGMMALSPEGEVLWVGRSMSAVNPPPSIGRIDTETMSAEVVEVVFPRPHAVAVGPDGAHAHTASLSINRAATVVDASLRVEMVTVPGPTHTLVQFAVSPDGARLAATAQTSGRLLVFDRTKPAELPVVADVSVGTWPWHPVYTPDGRYVVFGNKKDDTVTIVDAESWTVAGLVEGAGISQPHGAAAGPDGRFVYVSNNNVDGAWTPEGWTGPTDDDADPGTGPPGAITVIDVEEEAVVDVIPVGRDPNGIGIAPGR